MQPDECNQAMQPDLHFNNVNNIVPEVTLYQKKFASHLISMSPFKCGSVVSLVSFVETQYSTKLWFSEIFMIIVLSTS